MAGAVPRPPSSLPPRRELERSLLYSEKLGIDLAGANDDACFRWFLASLLFGARISETTAKHTYAAFVQHSLTTPSKIIGAGWDFLVNPVMREGGYVRYDGRKSTQILRDCERLLADYGGSMNRLHDAARDARDLEERLGAFYGVGPVTTNIFLRELRPRWARADPAPLPIVEELARELEVDLTHYKPKSLLFTRVQAGPLRNRRVLGGVSRAGYYRHFGPHASARDDTDLCDLIQRIALADRHCGYRRVTHALRRQGLIVNAKRVLRLMREDNLLALRSKPFVPRTTDSRHGFAIRPNLTRKMTPTALDQIWVADITYIRLAEGFVYLAVVIDAFSRKVVGWALDDHLEARLAIAALDEAIEARNPVPDSLIHHSDRGVQTPARTISSGWRRAASPSA
jgi:hypothetical protein